MERLAWLAIAGVVGAGLLVTVAAWGYALGHVHGLRQARAVALIIRGRAGQFALAPMPPEKAWALCAERIVAEFARRQPRATSLSPPAPRGA